MPGLICPLCQEGLWPGASPADLEAQDLLVSRHLVACDSREFLLADHLMGEHMQYMEDVSRRAVRCFCGQMLSENITVVMAHFKQYGGVAQHYTAWQLGVDP